MDIQGKHSYKQQTVCCAMAVYSFNCNTPDEEIDWQLNRAKEEAKQEWNGHNRDSGERCALVICVMPAEQSLKQRLEKRGFVKIFNFLRRRGYKQDNHLELMALKW